MSGHEHDETPLEQALRAPGSPAELSEEERYVAMFRAAGPGAAPVAAAASGGARRAIVRRLGAGSTLALVFAVGSAGVAAAYASSLPDPVQRVFHSVLAPIGVPPAESQGRVQTPQARPTPAPSPPDASAAPGPSSSPDGEPSVEPSRLPSDSPGATDEPSPSGTTGPSDEPSPSATTSGSPSASPSETPSTTPTEPPSTTPPTTPTETPSATPSATPGTTPLGTPSTTPNPTSAPTPTSTPAPTPASVSIVSAGAGQRVAPGGTAVVTGAVAAADGAPVPDAHVVLQARGAGGWHRVAVARTAGDGSVSMTTGPIAETTTVRLRAGGVPSTAWRIAVQPTLTVSSQTSGAATTLTASAAGGRAGDPVVLLVRRDGVLVQQARGTLDGAGAARFDVATPLRTTRYVVRLPATATHASASARVVVEPPLAPPPASPSATP